MTAARFFRGDGEPDLLRLFDRLRLPESDLEEPLLPLRLDAADLERDLERRVDADPLRLRLETADPLRADPLRLRLEPLLKMIF